MLKRFFLHGLSMFVNNVNLANNLYVTELLLLFINNDNDISCINAADMVNIRIYNFISKNIIVCIMFVDIVCIQ